MPSAEHQRTVATAKREIERDADIQPHRSGTRFPNEIDRRARVDLARTGGGVHFLMDQRQDRRNRFDRAGTPQQVPHAALRGADDWRARREPE